MTDEAADHPAPFSGVILDHLAAIVDAEVARRGLPRPLHVLDPFAGVGGIHALASANVATVGLELEREWADQHPHTVWGDVMDVETLFADVRFDLIVTSPCLAQHHRVLTDDLRWVAAGDVLPGDRLLAFDEYGIPGASGRNARRRWRRTEVVRSVPRTVECVRVILANGDEIVTTPEHPWLASRYAYGGMAAEWVRSDALMGASGAGRGLEGRRQPFYVHRQVEPWTERRSYDAGWLAGMFDGEGSLSLGVHGSPKLQMCQVEGAVLDRAERLMQQFGYDPNLIWRKAQGPNRQPVGNLYVTGGFPGILRALGELRPTRLLDKWAALDVTTRTVEAEKVAVVAVESAGRIDIQEIETTEGTYFGEGYLHHNCYGNRMADAHDAKDDSRRITYTHVLGRKLTASNAGAMQWGPKYQAFHEAAWARVVPLLVPDGRLVLNISDHYRDGDLQPVTLWHVEALRRLGMRVVDWRKVPTPRLGFGANGQLRPDHESIITFERAS